MQPEMAIVLPVPHYIEVELITLPYLTPEMDKEPHGPDRLNCEYFHFLCYILLTFPVLVVPKAKGPSFIEATSGWRWSG